MHYVRDILSLNNPSMSQINAREASKGKNQGEESPGKASQKASQKPIHPLCKIYSTHARQSLGKQRTSSVHYQPVFLVPILTKFSKTCQAKNVLVRFSDASGDSCGDMPGVDRRAMISRRPNGCFIRTLDATCQAILEQVI